MIAKINYLSHYAHTVFIGYHASGMADSTAANMPSLKSANFMNFGCAVVCLEITHAPEDSPQR
jgi:hypothetical protein